MTIKFNAKYQILKMKTRVNCQEITKEILSGSTRLFERTSPTKSENISFFYFKNIFQTAISIIKYLTKIIWK